MAAPRSAGAVAVAVSVLAAVLACADAFHFYLEPGASRCFLEQLPKDTLVVGTLVYIAVTGSCGRLPTVARARTAPDDPFAPPTQATIERSSRRTTASFSSGRTWASLSLSWWVPRLCSVGRARPRSTPLTARHLRATASHGGERRDLQELTTRHLLLKLRKESAGRFAFTSNEAGDHEVCIRTNQTTWLRTSQKAVRFDWTRRTRCRLARTASACSPARERFPDPPGTWDATESVHGPVRW